jgi:MOSC domain-containing protein
LPSDARLRLTALHVYPIKSAAGLAPAEWDVDGLGLRYDRRWMVVDGSGRMLTQRSHPRLALVRPSVGDGILRIETVGMPALELPLSPGPSVALSVTVWDDTCAAGWTGERAARWFSELLETECSLVHIAETNARPVDPDYAPAGHRVGFADGFPFLLISEESLEDLNRRLEVPLPMNRFRPNLVIAGGEPFGEDRMGPFAIGGIRFAVVKPCDRCVVTTTDQTTGERGPEPLRTLATFRRADRKVLFGQNVVHEGTGRLRVGDPLQV